MNGSRAGAAGSRAFDGALGLSVAAPAALVLAREGAALPLERLAPALLAVLAGLLLATRAAPRAEASWRRAAAALPALALGLCAPALGRLEGRAAALTFLFGAALTAWSLATLGRSFAVLPARRELVSRGPYAWIRHPAYAGELLMVLAVAAGGGPLAWAAAGALVAATALRLGAEERTLADDPGYARYRAAVRWRLLPWIY